MKSSLLRASGLGAAVALGTMALMLLTEPSLSIVWDEGYTLGREARLRDWLRALADPPRFAATWQAPRVELVQPDHRPSPPPGPDELNTRAKLFGPRALSWFWPFARDEPHGHPPFYAIVGLVGDLIFPSWPPLPRARFGPMLAFSLVAGALFGFAARRWGFWPAVAASGAWVLQPQLFGFGHYATYDALLACLWVGSILAFAKAVEAPERSAGRWVWTLLFGVLAGWAADTKLTGWFLPLPFFVWSALFRSRRGVWTLAVGGLVAVATLHAFCPPFWNDPMGGLERFLRSNLGREKTIPIKTLFLGQTYDTPRDSLPWYNTLAWTLFVTPVGFLILSVLGVVRAVRTLRIDPFGALVVGHWFFLLALRALPKAPGHDGIRQFLAAFGVLALVAGLGAAQAVEGLGRWGKALIAASLAEGALSIALMMPVPLSYFSPLVGGLPGASALGMEPTYYWDALTPEAVDWLNAHTPPGRSVRFATYPTSWLYLRQTGRLKSRLFGPRHLGFDDPDERSVAWYVVQNRPGAMSDIDRALIARSGPRHVLVAKWGVPLVWAFPYEEVMATLAAIRTPGGAP